MNAYINTANNNIAKNLARCNALCPNIACRIAALCVFLILLVLSGQTANADVVVDGFIGPQQTYGVTQGTTALQLRVRNTDKRAVRGVAIQTYLYFASDVNNGWKARAQPKSSACNLAPYQIKWITIPLPLSSLQGQALRNQYLYAKALLNGHEYWLLNFLNIPAQANVQISAVDFAGQLKGADTYEVTFTNNGYILSQPQQATVRTWQENEGAVGSALTQTFTIPALAVGQSYTLTFLSQPTEGYDITGSVQIGSAPPTYF